MCLTGARLYLPKEWCEDPERCRKAGVPEERIAQGLLTKIDLASELIDEALANGQEFSCVAMDSFYGRDGNLRRSLTQRDVIYCGDVPSNTRVFASKPTVESRPKQMSNAGERTALKRLARWQSSRFRTWPSQHPQKMWPRAKSAITDWIGEPAS